MLSAATRECTRRYTEMISPVSRCSASHGADKFAHDLLSVLVAIGDDQGWVDGDSGDWTRPQVASWFGATDLDEEGQWTLSRSY
jgi:hypothetical protein